jgi:LmbE family N-acetylglucosaminyl deacetylase
VNKKQNQDTDREIDHSDAEAMHALVIDIVENHKRFAWEIVQAWLRKNDYLIFPHHWTEESFKDDLKSRLMLAIEKGMQKGE